MSQAVTLNQNNTMPPSGKLVQLISGVYVSQAICVAAKLGIADLLKDGAKSSDELGVCRAYGKLNVNYAKFPLFRIDWEKVHQQQIYRN